jgi:hypothetical protein
VAESLAIATFFSGPGGDGEVPLRTGEDMHCPGGCLEREWGGVKWSERKTGEGSKVQGFKGLGG